MSEADDLDLEARAFLAMRGGAFGWQRDLAQYLRSNEPVSNRVRQAIADAVEDSTDDGITLRMAGHKRARDGWVGMHSRYEWVEIGQKIAELQAGGASRDEAVAEVANGKVTGTEYGLDKCLAALTYYWRVCRWLSHIEKIASGSTAPLPYSERQLVDLFHFNDLQGKPLDADMPNIAPEVE